MDSACSWWTSRPWIAGLVGSLALLGCGRGHAQTSVAAAEGGLPSLRCHAGWPMPNVPASHLPRPQSYDTTTVAGVVHDRVTGLFWQQVVDPRSLNLSAAVGYCAGLTLAGHDDWRAPAIIELVSIADTSRADPAADPLAFPDTPPSPFWSSQTDVPNTGLAWYVFFKTGGAYGGNDVSDAQRIRCVRGPRSCTDLVVSPYSTAGQGMMHDDYTGLTWQRSVDPKTYTWQDANRHCAELDPSGAGWRLPSLGELLTLVDFTRTEPAIDPSAFPDTPSEFFWSSSPSLAPPGTAWGVNFTRGSAGASLVASTAWARCVR